MAEQLHPLLTSRYPILKGQANYIAWCREFKLLARILGLWEIFDGSTSVFTDSKENDSVEGQSTLKEPQQKGNQADSEENEIHSEIDGKNNIVREEEIGLIPSVIIPEPKSLRDASATERDDQYLQRSRQAWCLLFACIEPCIRGAVQDCDTPQEAWEWIESQYKMPVNHAIKLVFNRVHNLYIDDFSSLQDYLNQLELHRQDMHDVGSKVDPEDFLKDRVLEGLSHSKRYAPIYAILRDSLQKNPKPTLKDLTGHLLVAESGIRLQYSSEAAKVSHAVSDNQEYLRCSQEDCRRVGHTIDNCWVAHPELRRDRQQSHDRWSTSSKSSKTPAEDERPTKTVPKSSHKSSNKGAKTTHSNKAAKLKAVERGNAQSQLKAALNDESYKATESKKKGGVNETERGNSTNFEAERGNRALEEAATSSMEEPNCVPNLIDL